MLQYTPPLRSMHFLIDCFDLIPQLSALPPHHDLDPQTLEAVLEHAARWATDTLLPLQASADLQGCQFDPQTHQVHTPEGFKDAYAQFVEAGWPALACSAEFGGQGLAHPLNALVYEMLNSTNMAWAMYPGLTHGAYAALLQAGTPTQKQLFLPPLVRGVWTGTMCLTEPQCGSDLGLIRTRATPYNSPTPLPFETSDPLYALEGTKIFISSGEHDLTENIVHLVLARLPDAPLGIKGLSLFVVPKYWPDAHGQLSYRNPIQCVGIEHKMGLHANATCHMQLDQALGTLVGAPHRGLQALFVMMNAARLGVGNQSIGLCEIVLQNALLYAQTRRQMRALSGAHSPQLPADPLLVHPDVRHKLLTAQSYTQAGRALQLYCSLLLEQELHHPDPQLRQQASEQLALLTPIAKAFLTDNGHRVLHDCLQIFGGHGFIQATGMEQLTRDHRITLIYEGTNAIQALDLLARKVLSNQGKTLLRFGEQIQRFLQPLLTHPLLHSQAQALNTLLEQLPALTLSIAQQSFSTPEEVGSAAPDYLRLLGHACFGYLWLRMGQHAYQALKQHPDDSFYLAQLELSEFYFSKLFPETLTLQACLQRGSRSVMNTPHALPFH